MILCGRSDVVLNVKLVISQWVLIAAQRAVIINVRMYKYNGKRNNYYCLLGAFYIIISE